MNKTLAVVLPCLCGLATPLLAEDGRVCTTEPEAVYGPAEEAKNHLLNGEFEEFFAIANLYVPSERDRRDEMIAISNANFPGGFESCITIWSEEMSDYLARQIVLYETSDARLFFASLTFVRLSEGWTIQAYLLSNNFSQISGPEMGAP